MGMCCGAHNFGVSCRWSSYPRIGSTWWKKLKTVPIRRLSSLAIGQCCVSTVVHSERFCCFDDFVNTREPPLTLSVCPVFCFFLEIHDQKTRRIGFLMVIPGPSRCSIVCTPVLLWYFCERFFPDRMCSDLRSPRVSEGITRSLFIIHCAFIPFYCSLVCFFCMLCVVCCVLGPKKVFSSTVQCYRGPCR